jgi:hypothetical protein
MQACTIKGACQEAVRKVNADAAGFTDAELQS